MAITSQRRIPVAREFVRLGFGDTIDSLDEDSPFYSLEFLTQELTTTEAQQVIPVVKRFNNFDGERVAEAIGRFKGRVSGWKFGAAGSPLLLVVLAPWSHQVEEIAGGASGKMFSSEHNKALVAELRTMFLKELNADKFEQNGQDEYAFGAWWD